MRKLIKTAALLLSTGLILFATSCKGNASATCVGMTVEFDHITSDKGDVSIEDAIKVIASFSDGSKKEVSGYIVDDGETESSKLLETGLNTIKIKYNKFEETVDIFKANQPTTDTPTLYTGDKTGLSQGADKDYYYFGDYAQNVAAISPEAISSKPAPNGWYIGSNGLYYAKSNDKYYSISPILWCEVTDSFDYDGHSEDFTAVTENEFNVLTAPDCENKASLLIAEKILAGGVPYYYTSSAYYEAANIDSDTNVRKVGETTIYTNNYEYSQLRAFLTGNDYLDLQNNPVSTYKDCGFLQGAFSATAQEKLLTVAVLNDGKSGTENCYRGYGSTVDSKIPALVSSTTNDKVFVSSMYELGTTAYGFGQGNDANPSMAKRLRSATPFAASNGAGVSYWTRTPYYKNGCSLRYVNEEGRTYVSTLASDTSIGVVPSIVVNIK